MGTPLDWTRAEAVWPGCSMAWEFQIQMRGWDVVSLRPMSHGAIDAESLVLVCFAARNWFVVKAQRKCDSCRGSGRKFRGSKEKYPPCNLCIGTGILPIPEAQIVGWHWMPTIGIWCRSWIVEPPSTWAGPGTPNNVVKHVSRTDVYEALLNRYNSIPFDELQLTEVEIENMEYQEQGPGVQDFRLRPTPEQLAAFPWPVRRVQALLDQEWYESHQ